MDILGNLEAMTGDDEPSIAHDDEQAPIVAQPVQSAPETGRDGMHVALASIADPEARERVLRIALDHQVDKRDPAWLMVEAAVVSMTAAAEARDAARLVHDDVAKIPASIQKAVVAGGADVSGQVRAALTSNLGEFAQAIGLGVQHATDAAVANVQTALKDFDQKVDKTIIARKDAVIAQWVQSGSDALDDRVREAIKTERTLNIAFMMFALFAALILGIALGMHLHF
ncbi:MAG: hypothetical protein M0003_13045 [Acidithiobacillus sp.]|nr:hypothetical protein [Acidithiobacillus sp.]